MSDRELCELIAKLWVENGGDTEGFHWNVSNVAIAIEDEIATKKEAEDQQLSLFTSEGK